MDWQAPESNAAWVSHTISKRVCTLCHIFDYATASVLFANNKGHSARVQYPAELCTELTGHPPDIVSNHNNCSFTYKS